MRKCYNSNAIYIDVRSESEFAKGHIPNAINMPILNDDERHQVGYTYKNVSVDEAKRLGLTFVTPKLTGFFDRVKELKAENPKQDIVFYCARGGFRSSSITALFNSIKEEVFCLDGGYKSYRSLVTDYFNQPENFPDFIMLHGLTGVGKTKHLQALKTLGYDILDLEEAAHHKGSHLGTIGQVHKQSAQDFENVIFETLSTAKGPFFVESESKRIGYVFIPNTLFDHMKKGKHLFIDLPMDERVNQLIEEYTPQDNFDAVIWPALEKIKRYISQPLYQELHRHLTSKNYRGFAQLLLDNHYDPVYLKSINHYAYDATFKGLSFTANQDLLTSWATAYFQSEAF